MPKLMTALLAAFATSGIALISGAGAAAAAPPYDGKVVTLILPNSPSGRMTQYARLIGPHLAKQLGSSEVRIKNVPGAGGLVGTNQLYSSTPDGFTIAFTSVPTLILAQLAQSEGVKFDATKFTYLGRVATEPRVLTVGAKSKLQTFDDIRKLNRPLVVPSQGTDEDFYTLAVIADGFGFPLKMVTGFQGNTDTALSVIKGEGDAHLTSWSSSIESIKAGDLRPVLTIGEKRYPGYENVPTVLELAPSGAKRQALEAIVNMLAMHRGFFGPPGMEPRATAAMRAAIENTLRDASFLADAKKGGFEIEFSDGATEQGRVNTILKASAGITPVLKTALAAIK